MWNFLTGLRLRTSVRRTGILLSLISTACILGLFAMLVGRPAQSTVISTVKTDLFSEFNMNTANRISDALDGVLSVEKKYWISADALSAPKPDPFSFGETSDPSEMAGVIERASALLDGQNLLFSTDVKLAPNSTIRYYLDDTILAIAWKEVHHYSVYSFAEVRIADASQFRRYLSEGKFGADTIRPTTEMAKSVNAVIASSGDYYRFRDVGVLVYNGEVKRVHQGMADSCLVDYDGNLHFIYRYEPYDFDSAHEYVETNNINFSLTFGPVIIDNGALTVPYSYVLGEINDGYPRAALCQLDELHYLIAMVNTEGANAYSQAMYEFAAVLQGKGGRYAYALDGGQTASLAVNGDLYNSVYNGYERWHSDILYFGTAIPD